MEHGRASRTAEHVAALRGLGRMLPQVGRLIDDPFGAEWTGWGRLRRLCAVAPGLAQVLSRPMWRWLLYMQVRTFALDDGVSRFAEGGGRQLVILGAGLDARALRLRHLGLRVFEVDHPATQRQKRQLVEASAVGDPAVYVAWDFEHDPVAGLPLRLVNLGYQSAERCCVIWEGVTMYLSEVANAATFTMLGDLLAPDSVVLFTYFSHELLAASRWYDRLVRRFVACHGEPWIFGWEPEELPAWLAARGFQLEHDDSTAVLAARWLPLDLAARLKQSGRRIAVARRL